MPRSILVVGSVHMDVLASYSKSAASKLDKIGRLDFRLGGVAYNVIANLNAHKVRARLFTCIRNNSLGGQFVKMGLRRSNTDLRFIQDVPQMSESGYIAHLLEDKLASAVTCVGIEHVQLNERLLRNAITECSIVALDTNLSREQITTITKLAHSLSKPVFVACASDSKIERICFPNEIRYRVVTLNRIEACAIGFDVEKLSQDAATALCKRCSSEEVVVTLGEAGFVVCSLDGPPQRTPAPNIKCAKNTTGAGDALFAAVCSHALDEPGHVIDWERCAITIRAYVVPVLDGQREDPGFVSDPNDQKEHILSMWCLLLLVLSGATTFVGIQCAASNPPVFGAMFFATPLLAGASGGLVRSMLTDHERERNTDSSSSLRAAVLGMAAGFISACVFFVAQLASNPDVMESNYGFPPSAKLLLLFGLIVGFVGGLTLDLVISKLRSQDVLPKEITRQAVEGEATQAPKA